MLLHTSILALALFVPVVAAAQTGTISGTVTDAATGLPIPNIDVRVFNGALAEVGSAVTNGAGAYSIPVSPVSG